MRHLRVLFICFIIVLYGLLQGLNFREAGAVGEVAIGWSSPPEVIIDTHPVQYDDGTTWGVLKARQTRPTEIIQLGENQIPIAINSYTSAIPDWPSAILFKLSNSPVLIKWFHIAMGGGLILLCIPFFGYSTSMVMGVVLATDWTFLLYKNLLGGTELCLQLSSMGMLWTIWKKKSWGWLIFWMALGIQAKITFVFVIVPFIVTILLFRIPLPKKNIKNALGTSFIFFLPLVLQAYHHHNIEEVVQSHDTWTMQWNRVMQAFSGSATEAIREQGSNVWLWMSNPLQFYERIYKLPSTGTWVPLLRNFGWFLCIAVCVAFRKNRNVQIITSLLLLSILSISYGPKDLHHYAMIVPIWALWVSVLAEQSKKWICVPFALSGIIMCMQTDEVFSQISVPTFNASQQKEFVEMLKREKVNKLITMDYEVYGLLEYMNTDLEVIHGWGAISHKRYRALPELLNQAKDGHLIILESSMPMRYNLRPTQRMLEEEAQKKGLQIEVQNQTAHWMLIRIYKSATEEL